MNDRQALGASFRDPAGFVFRRDGVLYRQVNAVYREHYERLMSSGLYDRLAGQGLLVAHKEIDTDPVTGSCYRILEPTPLDYISYPYEWCFSQLQDAALLTLQIQKIALEHGMWLKDASSFNIQFQHARPLLIDTLSFEIYRTGQPWPAYRQFCQHFLAPLSLAAYCDYQLFKLLRTCIDGIPLPLASRLLPWTSWLRYSLLSHIHLHARAQQKFSTAASPLNNRLRSLEISPTGQRAMVESLQSAVISLGWRPGTTTWGDYYSSTNYANSAMASKEQLLGEFLQQTHRVTNMLIDLGANDGRYTRVATRMGMRSIALDMDEVAVELNYIRARDAGERDILPLVQDLANPSPALGWAHQERMSLLERGPVDVVMALALIHHLAIGNNVPLAKCAAWFASLGRQLIIEFVPRTDSQVAGLLARREDVFPDYSQAEFERAIAGFFDLQRREQIVDSERVLYLFRRREAPD